MTDETMRLHRTSDWALLFLAWLLATLASHHALPPWGYLVLFSSSLGFACWQQLRLADTHIRVVGREVRDAEVAEYRRGRHGEL